MRAFSSAVLEVANSSLSVRQSRLVVKLSSPDTPARLRVECTASLGQLYRQTTVGRAVFNRDAQETRPVSVLGEPLM